MLSKMALELSDLPRGTVVEHQKYVRADGCVSAYERGFDVDGRRVGRSPTVAVESDLCLKRTVAAAEAEMEAARELLLRAPRSFIEDEFAGNEDFEDVRLVRRRALAVGNGGFEIDLRVWALLERFDLSLVLLRVDRVLGTQYMLSVTGGTLARSDVTRLAATFAGRMRSGLVPAALALPAISGQAQEGQTLSASRGAWRNAPTAFAYGWRRCNAAGTACAAVPGATSATYVLTSADVGSTVRVAVTARNGAGAATAVSGQTAVVTAAAAPVNTSPPTIGGLAQQGQTLTGSTGTWSGAPTAFAYQWQRCDAAVSTCSDVPGATGPTYLVGVGDAGSRLRLAVTATNAAGAATAVSAPTAVVP